MKIQVDIAQNIYVISLNGKLMSPKEVEDLCSLCRQFRDKNIKQLVFDLQNLDWTGSIGLGALISCVTTMRNAGGEIHFTSLNEKIQSLVSITKLDKVFRIFDSVPLAVQNFNAISH